MAQGAEHAGGWMLSGFQAVVTLWAWLGVVLAHGLWRSSGGAEQDPIRPAGPG